MRTLLTAVFSLAFLGFGIAEDKKEVPKELLPLQGKWKMTKTIHGGIDDANVAKSGEVLGIDGDRLAVYHGDKVNVEMTIKCDPSKSPKELDMVIPKGTVRAIYKIEKDTLTICFGKDADPKERPSAFESTKENNLTVLVMERVKSTAEILKELPELQPFQGKWKVTQMVAGGMEDAERVKDDRSFVIEGNTIAMYRGDVARKEEPDTIKIDSTKKPITLDIETRREGVLRGICKIEKDTLTICFAREKAEEKDRATKFESTKENMCILIVLEKVK